jgi:hypothetical protein
MPLGTPQKKLQLSWKKPAEKKAAVVMENACASTGRVDTALLSNLRCGFLINQKKRSGCMAVKKKHHQKTHGCT